MTEDIAAELEAQIDGFRACLGGEELRRAVATLSGALLTDGGASSSGDAPDGDGDGGAAAAAALAALLERPDPAIRELALAARRYDAGGGDGDGGDGAAAAAVDYDGRYNHGLVLQELSARLPPGSPEQVALLQRACGRYEAALELRPRSHQALYNWGVALSDLARALKAGSPSDAAACLAAASRRYAASLTLAPGNPQALNNWGLVLQELSGDAKDWRAREALVRAAMAKFRLAVRARPDFDRGCYNLGTVCYTYAAAMQNDRGSLDVQQQQTQQQQQQQQQRAGGAGTARDAAARSLFGAAAQYIALAAALAPAREVYRKSLAVVRPMLPLPFLRAGFLTAPLARGLGGLGEVYRREWFVLDAASLRSATHMESTLSAASQGLPPAPHQQQQPRARAGAPPAPDDDPLVLELADVTDARRARDPSLPEGEALWIGLASRPLGVFLVADDADDADAWVDALVLCARLAANGRSGALADALTPQPQRRAKQHAAAAAAMAGSPHASSTGT